MAERMPSVDVVPVGLARLDDSNKLSADDATTLIRIVPDGAAAVATDAGPGPLAMPAFDRKLDDAHVAGVLTYIRSARGNAAGPVSAGDAAAFRERLE